jgi:hypothetical protein
MAWTAPMTAIAGSVFTAAQFNTFVRDNLNETAAAKATIPGAHFAVSDTNQLAQRVLATASTLVTETTTSTVFTDLATIGPSVSVTTGVAALVFTHCGMENSGTGSVRMGYEVSGASSVVAADNKGSGLAGTGGLNVVHSCVTIETGLTPGVNVFTAKYRVSASVGTFLSRRIGVVPF